MQRYYTSLPSWFIAALAYLLSVRAIKKDIARLDCCRALVVMSSGRYGNGGDEYHEAFRQTKAAVRPLGDALGSRQG